MACPILPVNRSSRRPPGARRHRIGDPGVGTHHGAFADHGVATQDRGIGVDDHVVLDGRVALGHDGLATVLGHRFLALDRKRAQGDALVDAHGIADVRGLADDDAGAVVDEERRSDGGAGVDIDPGAAMRVLGHHARQKLAALAQQAIGGAEDGNRIQPRVAGDDLVGTGGGGIGLEGDLDILGENRTQFGQGRQRARGDGARLAACTCPASAPCHCATCARSDTARLPAGLPDPR
jgi:hypothetical protein